MAFVKSKSPVRPKVVPILAIAALCLSVSAFGQQSTMSPGASQGSANSQSTSQATPSQPKTADGSSTLKEVVVTAERRQELSLKVPISLAVLGPQSLELRGVTDLKDLQAQVPGVVVGSGVSGNQELYIRGVGIDVPASAIESPVATYIDGVYQARSFRPTTLSIDLNQIEVLKGPQGTFFGRNATGGAILETLEEPTQDFYSVADASFGNYGKMNFQGVVSGPVIDHALELLVAVAYDRYTGDIENLYSQRLTGSYINGTEDKAGRIALRAHPFKGLTAVLSIMANKTSGGGVAPDITNILVGSPTLETQDGILPPTETMPNLFINGPYPHKVKLNSNDDGDTNNEQVDLTLNWALSWGTLKSISALQSHHLTAAWDGDGTARDLLQAVHNAKTTAFSQELDLLGSTRWFTLTAGIYYFHEHFSETFGTALNGTGIPAFVLNAAQIGYEDTRSSSAFGDVTVPLLWGFKAFGGVRYTDDKKDLTSSVIEALGNINLVIPGSTCENLETRDTFTNWSPRYGLQWTPNDRIDVYVQRSYGYNAGGNYYGNCNDPYKSETLSTVEAGVKSRWFGGRLVADADVFNSDFNNFQVYQVIGLLAQMTNAKVSKQQGAEFKFVGLPFKDLTLDTSLSLLDAHFTSFAETDFANPGAGVQNLDGQEMPGSPKVVVNFGAEYAWSIFRVRGEFYHTDSIIFRPFGDTGYGGSQNQQGGYNIYNAYLIVTPHDKPFELRFFGKNLSDTQYYVSKFAFPWGQRVGIAGLPRTYGVEFTIRWL